MGAENYSLARRRSSFGRLPKRGEVRRGEGHEGNSFRPRTRVRAIPANGRAPQTLHRKIHAGRSPASPAPLRWERRRTDRSQRRGLARKSIAFVRRSSWCDDALSVPRTSNPPRMIRDWTMPLRLLQCPPWQIGAKFRHASAKPRTARTPTRSSPNFTCAPTTGWWRESLHLSKKRLKSQTTPLSGTPSRLNDSAALNGRKKRKKR